MKRIHPAVIAAMPVMYRAGQSAMSIAEELNVSADAVRYHLLKAGCEMPGRGRKKLITPEVARAALRIHQGGICWKNVAKLLGFNIQSLQVEARKIKNSDKVNQERVAK